MDMEQLFQILKESVSACHTVLSCEKRLKAQGFLPLSMEKEWKLEEMGKYYVKHRDSSLFAFTVGKDFDRDIPVTGEDRIITLSTCIWNPAYRFLVQGVLVSDEPGAFTGTQMTSENAYG